MLRVPCVVGYVVFIHEIEPSTNIVDRLVLSLHHGHRQSLLLVQLAAKGRIVLTYFSDASVGHIVECCVDRKLSVDAVLAVAQEVVGIDDTARW